MRRQALYFTEEERLRTIGQNLPIVRSAASISHIFHIAQLAVRGSAGKHERTRKVSHRVYSSAAPFGMPMFICSFVSSLLFISVFEISGSRENPMTKILQAGSVNAAAF